jgi:hypothetical protein
LSSRFPRRHPGATTAASKAAVRDSGFVHKSLPAYLYPLCQTTNNKQWLAIPNNQALVPIGSCGPACKKTCCRYCLADSETPSQKKAEHCPTPTPTYHTQLLHYESSRKRRFRPPTTRTEGAGQCSVTCLHCHVVTSGHSVMAIA